MIRILDNLWVGNSDDMQDRAELKKNGINAILCVAHDLQSKLGWERGFLFAQCGLVDGPGNRLAVYHAAILMLSSMLGDGKRVLVADHNGGRAMAVCVMYMTAKLDHGWDKCFAIAKELNEVVPLPEPAHREAYFTLDWEFIRKAIR